MITPDFAPHDHSACRDTALDVAARRCAEKGLQWTKIRQRVLEILLDGHRAMGAYEVLDVLRADGHNAQPPVAYRALDFLVANGFVHRIERLNAFIACSLPGQSHAPVFMICENCSIVAEAHLDLTDGRLGEIADSAGFRIGKAMVEIEGLCPNWQGRRVTQLVRLENVAVRLAGHSALHDVSLTLDRGEIVTVVGPNGSGKTTLMRTILGALKPSTGQITRMAGLRIGYVPQKLHIDPTLPLTVHRFLSLPHRISDDQARKALENAGAEHLQNRQMTELSGGQFQRVLLARAIQTAPDLLILDEPTQGLDQPGSAAFYQRIEEVRTELGCAVLMVSHELHVVMAASDRVICLNGHICCQGPPEHVATAPEYRALFGPGTGGALALYRHDHHGHSHDHDHPNPLEPTA